MPIGKIEESLNDTSSCFPIVLDTAEQFHAFDNTSRQERDATCNQTIQPSSKDQQSRIHSVAENIIIGIMQYLKRLVSKCIELPDVGILMISISTSQP